MELRDASGDDLPALAHIYNHYVEHSTATFEEVPVDLEEFAGRVQRIRDTGLPWLVAAGGGAVRGYAYAAPWRQRSAYRHTVEVTVYVAPDSLGAGFGTALYEALFARLAAAGCHTAIGVVTLPNDASVALHEKCGMRRVGRLREVGRKHGRWLDVGYWQRMLGHG